MDGGKVGGKRELKTAKACYDEGKGHWAVDTWSWEELQGNRVEYTAEDKENTWARISLVQNCGTSYLRDIFADLNRNCKHFHHSWYFRDPRNLKAQLLEHLMKLRSDCAFLPRDNSGNGCWRRHCLYWHWGN